jgi:hypothetical protein
LPILYLRGVSTGDFQEALAALLGKDAPNLSPAGCASHEGGHAFWAGCPRGAVLPVRRAEAAIASAAGRAGTPARKTNMIAGRYRAKCHAGRRLAAYVSTGPLRQNHSISSGCSGEGSAARQPRVASSAYSSTPRGAATVAAFRP